MKTIASVFKSLSAGHENNSHEVLVNPSQVLRVHREEISGTLELVNLNEDFASSPLRVSWIKKENASGQMKPVWINEEMMLM